MSIPKRIHYCWFGHNPKPASVKHCMRTWKKHNPGYEIIEWNEDNFDLKSCPQYVQEAYAHKKWAFVTDYVRLRVVYENGGIYLDTDVEMLKNLDFLLPWQAYFGFEDGSFVNTGLGYGAEKGCVLLKEIMDSYDSLSFVNPDGSLNLIGCPRLNTSVFMNHGLVREDRKQILDGSILILPRVYMDPMDYVTRQVFKTEETISIHRCDGTWLPEEEQKEHLALARYLKKERIRVGIIEKIKSIVGPRVWGVVKSVKRHLWK